MRRTDLFEMLSLAAIWGASFLFMRLGAAEFGPVTLAAVRVAGAFVFLAPLLALRGEWPALRAHWKPILVVGITNSAIPFLCFTYAALSITAGLSSIFNSTSPLWGAIVAWIWLKKKITPWRTFGLFIGFAGVLGLAWDKASFKAGADGFSSGWAIVACLLAALLYGFSANYTQKRLAGVPPMALTTGSQLFATLALAGPGIWFWPAQLPGTTSWIAALCLALLCTGLAYVMYFRLIANVGPANAIAVTFLVPAFAVLWGALFLHETITAPMVAGCVVILIGTALAIGLLQPPSLRGGPGQDRPSGHSDCGK